MDTVIDFSASVPSAASLQAAGHAGAVMYISPPRESWMGAKPALRPTIDDFDAHGLQAAFVWQYGKEKNPDVMRGWDGGVADAKAAQAHLDSIQCSGHPVFFAVDFNIGGDPDQPGGVDMKPWNNVAVKYFQGAASVLGKQRVGIYGHSRVVHWAMEDDAVATVAPGRVLGWVTRSWSKGKTGADYAVLYQREHNIPGPDGVQIDVNDVLHPEWGWRALDSYQQPPRETVIPENITMRPNPEHRGDPLFLPDLLKLWGVEVEEFDGWRNRGHGDFGEIWGVVAHHTAGANTPPSLIAYGHAALRGLLSQIHLARNGTATLVGAGLAWHAGAGSWPGIAKDAANWVTIGVEAVNAGDGSQPWTAEQMDAYRRICAAIGWYLGKTAAQILGHKEWSSGGKIDPNFDMNVFRADVQDLIDNPPFLKEMDTMALDLTKRYGFRTPEGYYEGADPGSGTLLDIWLNTDTHSWVSRVNTEALLNKVDRLEQKLDQQRQDNQALVTALSELTVVLAKGLN